MLRFVPRPGVRERREIVGQVRLDGVPASDRVVARFRADVPPRVGKPVRLMVRRRGSVVVASWRGAPNAERYVAVLRLRNGVQRVVRVSDARRSIRLTGVPLTQAGTVTLRGLADPEVLGPAATARFTAPRTLPSPFRPYAELRDMRPRARGSR